MGARVRVGGLKFPGAVVVGSVDLGLEKLIQGLKVLRAEVANIGGRISIRSRGGRIEDVACCGVGERRPDRVLADVVVAVSHNPNIGPANANTGVGSELIQD